MSEIQKPLNTLIEERKSNYSKLGEAVTRSEFALTDRANSAIQRLKNPSTIEDVPVAEKTLENITKELNSIIEERKKVTNIFAQVATRLMAPENLLKSAKEQFASTIVGLKTIHEKQQQSVKEKQLEIKTIKEYLLNEASKFDQQSKNKINNLISLAYQHALGAGNISTLLLLKEYLIKVETRLSENDFIYNPEKPRLVLVTEEEYSNLLLDIDIKTDYVLLFKEELKKRFSDYEIAWQNKEQAFAIQKKEDEEKQKKLEEEKRQKDSAAKLASMAHNAVPVSDIKPLKKMYVLDMEETEKNANIILSSFISNYSLVFPKIRTTKPFNLSVKNMIKGLESVRNEDNSFDCTGLIWKEISKLK